MLSSGERRIVRIYLLVNTEIIYGWIYKLIRELEAENDSLETEEVMIFFIII